MRELADLAGIEWHLIGPLQSNKTRVVAETMHWVHSVDRLKIAERLSAQRPADLPPLNICIQVNISGEASKSGCAPDEAVALAKAASGLPRLRVRGMMMGTRHIGAEATRSQFALLARLYAEAKTTGRGHRYAVDGHVRRSRNRGRVRLDDGACRHRAVWRPTSQSATRITVKKICFVGGGNMASAMLAGLRREHPALSCHVIEPLHQRARS